MGFRMGVGSGKGQIEAYPSPTIELEFSGMVCLKNQTMVATI